MLLDGPSSWRQGDRPRPIDEAEDFSEPLPRHRDLRQVESDMAAPGLDHEIVAESVDLHETSRARGEGIYPLWSAESRLPRRKASEIARLFDTSPKTIGRVWRGSGSEKSSASSS